MHCPGVSSGYLSLKANLKMWSQENKTIQTKNIDLDRMCGQKTLAPWRATINSY